MRIHAPFRLILHETRVETRVRRQGTALERGRSPREAPKGPDRTRSDRGIPRLRLREEHKVIDIQIAREKLNARRQEEERQQTAPKPAVLRSFVSSCKRVGVEPFAWFHDVLSRVASHPVNRLAELLPHNWASAQAQ